MGGNGIEKISEIMKARGIDTIVNNVLNTQAIENTSGSTFGNEIIDTTGMGYTVEANPQNKPESETETKPVNKEEEEHYRNMVTGYALINGIDDIKEKIEQSPNKKYEVKSGVGTNNQDVVVTYYLDENDELFADISVVDKDNSNDKEKIRKGTMSLVRYTDEKGHERTIWVYDDVETIKNGVTVKRFQDFGHASDDVKEKYEETKGRLALSNNRPNTRRSNSVVRKEYKQGKEDAEQMVKENMGLKNKRDIANAVREIEVRGKVENTFAHSDAKEYRSAKRETRKAQKATRKQIREEGVISRTQLEQLNDKHTNLSFGSLGRKLRKLGYNTPDTLRQLGDDLTVNDDFSTPEERAILAPQTGFSQGQIRKITGRTGHDVIISPEKIIKTSFELVSVLGMAAKVANGLLKDQAPELCTKILNAIDSANALSNSQSTADALANGHVELIPDPDGSGNWILKIVKTVIENEDGVETLNQTTTQEILIDSQTFAGLIFDFEAVANAEASAEASAEALAELKGKIGGILKSLGYDGKKEIIDAAAGYLMGLLPGVANCITFEAGRNSKTFIGNATKEYFEGKEADAIEENKPREYQVKVENPCPPAIGDNIPPTVDNGNVNGKEPCDCEDFATITVPKTLNLGETEVNSKGETVSVYYGLLDKDILKCFKVAEGQEVAEGSPIPNKQFKAFIEEFREEKLGSKRAYIGKGEQEICMEFTFNGIKYKFDLQAFDKLVNDFELDPKKFRYYGGGKNIKAGKITDKPC